MDKVVQENAVALAPDVIKRGRGRPRKHPLKDQNAPKRGRGRPRKHAIVKEKVITRGRGRPRKYPVLEKEILPNGEIKPNFKKVDSCHLLKHMLTYFTKLMIVHSQMSKSNPNLKPVFDRLKSLDFQMSEVCRTVLAREFGQGDTDEDMAA